MHGRSSACSPRRRPAHRAARWEAHPSKRRERLRRPALQRRHVAAEVLLLRLTHQERCCTSCRRCNRNWPCAARSIASCALGASCSGKPKLAELTDGWPRAIKSTWYHGEKRQFTVLTTTSAAGQMLPHQVVVKGKPAGSLPKFGKLKISLTGKNTNKVPKLSVCFVLATLVQAVTNIASFCATYNHWSDNITSKAYVKDIVVPYFKAKIETMRAINPRAGASPSTSRSASSSSTHGGAGTTSCRGSSKSTHGSGSSSCQQAAHRWRSRWTAA